MKSRVSRLGSMVCSVFSMALAGVIVSTATAPKASAACGGLFCSQISPTPVDQASERIIFQVNDDQILWPTVDLELGGGGCTSARNANVGGAVSLALLFGSSVALRLKRRRRHR